MKRLTKARQRLVERHLEVAQEFARRKRCRFLDHDEKLSSAYEALCIAAAYYRRRTPSDPPFRGYAKIVMSQVMNHDNRKKGIAELQHELPEQEEQVVDAGDDPAERIDQVDEAQALIHDRLYLLTRREREVILGFLGGLKWHEVAAQLGVVKVCTLRRLALAKLREASSSRH